VLEANFTKQLGTLPLNVRLTAMPGGTLVLVGESGAGKTSILNVLAGLMRPDSGIIRLDGERYFESATQTMLPAHARAVGYVLQDYVLFPHLSAFENVAFGLRAQGMPRASVRRQVHEVFEQLGIAALSAQRPRHLSGGQQQRVALARALVVRPRLLLLDEPLAALDAQTRRDVRGELRRTLATLPCVTLLVTHSPIEAFAFGDRIAVVERGCVVQHDSPDDLLERPRSRYAAELMGLNFLRGRVAARDSDGMLTVDVAGGTVRIVHEADRLQPGDDPVYVTIDPREITLHTSRPEASAQNVFAGAIVHVVPEPPLGQRVRVTLATQPLLVAEVSTHAVHTLGLREGRTVYATFKATAARAYE